MNFKTRISMAMAAALVLGTISYVPASADDRDGVAASSPGAVAVLASPETPQDQVWDMTYGAERPVVVAETAAAAVDDAPIVDFTFG
jgi:hypothetical protein